MNWYNPAEQKSFLVIESFLGFGYTDSPENEL